MLDAGHGDRILLGADTLTADGAAAPSASPAAPALLQDTAARLARRFGEQALNAVLVENPARAFAWSN